VERARLDAAADAGNPRSIRIVPSDCGYLGTGHLRVPGRGGRLDRGHDAGALERRDVVGNRACARQRDFPVRCPYAFAFSAFDVWLSRLTPHGSVAYRYDGSTWRLVKPPAQPDALAGVSASDVWAVGPTDKTALKSPARQVLIAANWTGRRWRTVPRVWMSGAVTRQGQSLSVAYQNSPGHRWTLDVLPIPAGYDGSILELSGVPHSRSVWAIGTVRAGNGAQIGLADRYTS
jgi:hypothetical protein